MSRAARASLILCALLASSCRMADGPVPDARKDDVPNRVGDLARDLGNVAAGHEEARTDFIEDLMSFVDIEEKPDATEPIKALGNQVIDVMLETKATEAAVVPMLEKLYVALSATDLSENQAKAVAADVQGAASQLGLGDVKARALAAQVGIVQQSVTERHRRWYEVF